MAIIRHKGDYTALDAAALERWKGVPPAVAGDCLNRTASMAGRVSPLHPDMRIIGHARTIRVMAGDNACVHAAIPCGRYSGLCVGVCSGRAAQGIRRFYRRSDLLRRCSGTDR